MQKKFKKASKKINKYLLVFFLVLALTFTIINWCNHTYNKIKESDNSLVVSLLLKNSFESLNIDNLKQLKDPTFLIMYTLNKKLNIKREEIVTESFTDKSPTVYIYNTHQTETYSNNSFETFNITPTVLTGSFILKEYLNNYHINSLVEENKVNDILNYRGWKYGYSYAASRELLEKAYLNNNTLKYFLDIHRDSGKYELTTANIADKVYAKILFVIGLENTNYEKNLKFATFLNDWLQKNYPTLSRGIIKKSGKGVNGVYNQDFNENTILIEVGGENNSLNEVNNTMKILAEVLSIYMGGQNGI